MEFALLLKPVLVFMVGMEIIVEQSIIWLEIVLMEWQLMLINVHVI